MFEVSIGACFRATHQLCGVDGAMEPVHGHEWGVRVTVRGSELDDAGLLVDFKLLQRQLDQILSRLRDRHLNEVSELADQSPSAERIAEFIGLQLADEIPRRVVLRAVSVEEEPGCSASFFPE